MAFAGGAGGLDIPTTEGKEREEKKQVEVEVQAPGCTPATHHLAEEDVRAQEPTARVEGGHQANILILAGSQHPTSCSLCSNSKASFLSQKDYDRHVQGKKHQSNLAAHTHGTPTAGDHSRTQTTIDHAAVPAGGASPSPLTPRGLSSSFNEGKTSRQVMPSDQQCHHSIKSTLDVSAALGRPSDESSLTPSGVSEPPPQPLACDLCSVTLKSTRDYTRHMASRGHAAACAHGKTAIDTFMTYFTAVLNSPDLPSLDEANELPPAPMDSDFQARVFRLMDKEHAEKYVADILRARRALNNQNTAHLWSNFLDSVSRGTVRLFDSSQGAGSSAAFLDEGGGGVNGTGEDSDSDHDSVSGGDEAAFVELSDCDLDEGAGADFGYGGDDYGGDY
jgi:uncharacterized C2H2 Zn-finger protein